MKNILLLCITVILFSSIEGFSFGCNKCSIATNDFQKVVSIIYVIEGGSKTLYPYGIKSIKTNNKEEAKQICYNTVRNNYHRWKSNGAKETCYIEFLGNRYCPSTSDKQGNKNWKRNLRKML